MGTCAWLAALAVPVSMSIILSIVLSIGLPSNGSLIPSRGSPTAPRQPAAALGCLTLSFLPHADCRYTCHPECRSLIQLDCRPPGQCQSQLSPESTLLSPCSQVRRGGGSAGPGGTHSLVVTNGISFRDLVSCS